MGQGQPWWGEDRQEALGGKARRLEGVLAKKLLLNVKNVLFYALI